MFFLRKKLDSNLQDSLSSKFYSDFRVLVRYSNFKDNICKKILSYKGTVIHTIDSCKLICATLTSKSINRLIEYPEIEYICLDEFLFVCGMNVQTANKAKASNNLSYTGKGIGIGLIDTGVYPHKDLIAPFNNLADFTDVINDFKYPYDDNGHGTCMAGIICGNGSSSSGMYKGIAPDSKLYCYKAFNKLGRGYASDVMFSLEQLILRAHDHNIKLICMPCELLTYNSCLTNYFEILFKFACSNNIVVVVPSGSKDNMTSSILNFANSKDCLTIGGLNTKGIISPYLYSGAGLLKKSLKPDFSAACCDIVSLNCDKNYVSDRNGVKQYPKKLDVSYTTFSGTSLATAYIVGLCALIFEENNSYTFNDIKSLLTIACEPIDDIKPMHQGLGPINIKNILN